MNKVGGKVPVTLMVMTYNQAPYAAAAVEAALTQDYDGPLEVLISDDASTDGTTEVLRALVSAYDGPHRLRLNVNRRNLGLIPHLHKVFALATHDFVVCCAGDDVSRSDRVRRLADLQAHTGAWLLYSDTHFMNADGLAIPGPDIRTTFSTDWTLADVAGSAAVFVGASAAYHKDLFRTFGPIVEGASYEDLVLAFRAALLGRVAYCDAPLVRYRIGPSVAPPGNQGITNRGRSLTVFLAVLRQRLLDAKGFGLSYGHPATRTLRRAISRVSAELADAREAARLSGGLASET
jgi:glycosyltransferase involved in cell wall biosynthesis